MDPIKKKIQELDEKARAIEDWLMDNINDPGWDAKINEYTDALFRLYQANQEKNSQGREIPYRPTVYLPRFINKSENVKR